MGKPSDTAMTIVRRGDIDAVTSAWMFRNAAVGFILEHARDGAPSRC